MAQNLVFYLAIGMAGFKFAFKYNPPGIPAPLETCDPGNGPGTFDCRFVLLPGPRLGYSHQFYNGLFYLFNGTLESGGYITSALAIPADDVMVY